MASSNKNVVPEAKEALNRFKMEAASEVGVNLKQGYNGHLTSREAGSIGGQMVKTCLPERTFFYDRNLRTQLGHIHRITYTVQIVV